MAVIVKPYTFAASAAAYAEHVNANFDQAYALINGDIDRTNLRDEMFVTTFQFHHAGLIPGSAATPRGFNFTWPTINDASGVVELTITEIGIAFSNTTGDAAEAGIARLELYEWGGAAWVAMGGQADAVAKYTPVLDTAFTAGKTTLEGGKTYALQIASVVADGAESNAEDVDVWLEGKTTIFERHTG